MYYIIYYKTQKIRNYTLSAISKCIDVTWRSIQTPVTILSTPSTGMILCRHCFPDSKKRQTKVTAKHAYFSELTTTFVKIIASTHVEIVTLNYFSFILLNKQVYNISNISHRFYGCKKNNAPRTRVTFFKKEKGLQLKQCRPWSDAMFCSWSTLLVRNARH